MIVEYHNSKFKIEWRHTHKGHIKPVKMTKKFYGANNAKTECIITLTDPELDNPVEFLRGYHQFPSGVELYKELGRKASLTAALSVLPREFNNRGFRTLAWQAYHNRKKVVKKVVDLK